MTPDVSVVVISYNDVERLPRAIASVQQQTLRNLEIIVVDDHSADDSERVVRALAAGDGRIRYERLPANSGGCSAPRNRGIELATAPWVMFCDSDDEYERHACKNLLLAAERLDAEVVCGAADRIDARTGRVRPWRPELHDDERVVDSLVDYPELLADTISVNKIYSRALLDRESIRFPEGLLFEDQLFTLEAMSAARRVAVIPQVVYRWYVDSLSDELSITQRRMERRNVDDRIEINRRIDAFLASRGLDDIRRVKDVKFLRHDLYVYLAAIVNADDATASMLLERLRPYVASIDPRLAWQVRPALRVAIYHLLADDPEGVREAMRFVTWASTVDVPIVERDGHQFWGCGHLDTGPEAGGIDRRQWLDVTDLHLLDIPFTQRRYLHRLETLDVVDGRLVASGTSVDYDGLLEGSAAIDLRLMSGQRAFAIRVDAAWVPGDRSDDAGDDGPRRRWRAEGALEAGLERVLDDRDGGAVSLAVRREGLVNITAARWTGVGRPTGLLRYPGAVASDGPEAIGITSADNAGVGWSAVRATGRAPVREDRPPSFWRDEVLIPLLSRVGGWLPARRVLLVDTSDPRPANAEVRAIATALADQHPQIEQFWVHRGRPTRVPASATAVERLSLRHHWLAAQARWRLDDGTATLGVRYRRRGATVFALDGIPVHRIGLDDPSVMSEKAAVKEVRRRVRRWTTVLAASDFSADVVARAYARKGGAEVTGLARLDSPLRLRRADDVERARLRGDLDLPRDRPVVLYAPVRRSMDREPGEPLLDLEGWAQALGDRAYLLLRAQPGERFHVSTRLRFAVRDISDPDDVGDFLAASDLVISDYATTIADAAALDLPIALFHPDADIYVNRTHGVYPDLSLLGPRSQTLAELVADVRSWLADPEAWQRRWGPGVAAYAQAHCGPLDGASAQRTVDAVIRAGR